MFANCYIFRRYLRESFTCIFEKRSIHVKESHVYMWKEIYITSTCSTGCRRPIRCLTLQVTFRKRSTNHRAFLRKMTCEDQAFCGSSPPCTSMCNTCSTSISLLIYFPWLFMWKSHMYATCNTWYSFRGCLCVKSHVYVKSDVFMWESHMYATCNTLYIFRG